MKVRITFEVEDKDREAIGERYGKDRADYHLVRSWIESTIWADLEAIRFDHQTRDDDEEPER